AQVRRAIEICLPLLRVNADRLVVICHCLLAAAFLREDTCTIDMRSGISWVELDGLIVILQSSIEIAFRCVSVAAVHHGSGRLSGADVHSQNVIIPLDRLTVIADIEAGPCPSKYLGGVFPSIPRNEVVGPGS